MGPDEQARRIEEVIDTGFTGFLTMPTGLVAELRLPFVNTSQAILADGSEATLNAYRATVLRDGYQKHVGAYAPDASPLIGMRMLDDYDLSIQVRDDVRVIIQAGD